MLLLILLIVIIIIIIIIIIIRALGIYKRVNICNNFSIVGDLYGKMFLTFFLIQAVIFFVRLLMSNCNWSSHFWESKGQL